MADGALIVESALPGLIEQLPDDVRAALARGPMLPGEGDDCRVCEALDMLWLRPLAPWAEARCAIHDFHQAEGKHGEAAYRRCVAIYRAAGWTGEYDARDLHGFEGDDG